MLNRRGFSMLEMLVVCVLMGIMLAISLPNTRAFFIQSQTELAKSQLLQAIQFARAEAREYSSIILCKSVNHQTCSPTWQGDLIIFQDTFHDNQITDHSQLLMLIPTFAKGQLYWRAFPYYRHFLLFETKESLQTDNGTFWYCETKKSPPAWAIVVNKNGRARVMSSHELMNMLNEKVEKLTCS